MHTTSVAAFFSTLYLALFIAGCGKNEAPAIGEKSAATVNGQAIGIAQVEVELQRVGDVPPDQKQALADKVLQSAIDRQLLAQQAAAEKLEETPAVRGQLALARDQILAETYIEHLGKGLSEPSDAETKEYFDTHPELFSKRRIFKLQELMIQTTAENIEDVKSRVTVAKNLPALARALQRQGIPMRGRQLVKAAEDLPADVLAKLTGLAEGQSFLTEAGGTLNVVILAGSESRPVSLDQAKPVIRRYLLNSRKQAKVKQELVSLRARAKIEYRPPYASASANTGQSPIR